MYQKIKGEKYNIECKVWMPSKVERMIFAIHGFAGDNESSAIASLAEKMLDDNTMTVALDLPGHGKSEVDGDYLTLDNCFNDILTVENYYKEKYPEASIDYFATSFGAYLLLLLISKKKCLYNRIVLRCPAIAMDKIFDNAILNDSLEKKKKKGYTIVGYERELKVNYSFYKELIDNQIFDIYQTNKNKILIIHGDQDDTAPITDSIAFMKKYNTKMEIIKGADHRFKKEGELDKVVELARNFYNE